MTIYVVLNEATLPPTQCALVFAYIKIATRCSFLTQGRLRAAVVLSAGGALLLMALEATLPAPKGLPYLHPTLNALYSCANFIAAYGIGVCWQWREGDRGSKQRGSPRETETKKRR